MDHVDLLTFPDEQALAQAAAEEWLRQLESLATKPEAYCVALSGGRITRVFYQILSRISPSRPGWRASVHIFWSDERCVPPEDPESNFGIARELLLAPSNIPQAQIHRVRGEDPPALAASQAEAELRQIAPAGSGGQPVLDLVFLGMGEDGHVASLFPGESEETMASQAVYRAVTATKPPPHRVTMGYLTIAAARQVWVLVSGPGKEAALRESLAPAGLTPLAKVLGLRCRTRILTAIQK